MAGATVIMVIGNPTADPPRWFTASGAAAGDPAVVWPDSSAPTVRLPVARS